MNFATLSENLKDNYKETFERVELYASIKEIGDEFCDEALMNLYDLLYTAQTNQQPVEKIIGADLEEFCKNYFQEYTLTERVKDIPNRLYRVFRYAFIVEIILLIPDWPKFVKNIFSYKTDLTAYFAGLLVGALVSAIGSAILKPLIMKNRKVKPIVYSFVILGMFILFVAVSVLLLGEHTLMIPIIPVLATTGLYIIIYQTARAISNYKKYGTIRNVKKKELKKLVKADEKNSSDNNFRHALMEGLNKRYQKLAQKKGMTKEAFHALVKKEQRILDIVIPIIFAAFVIVPPVHEILQGGKWYDALFFFLVLGIVESVIYWGLNRGDVIRKNLLKDCDEKGMNLIDYINEHLNET